MEPAKSRYIASEVTERQFERVGYQCEYVGPDGKRCPCRTGLQIEHSLPFAIWRTHDERYLRVFCPRHNRFSAERVYGAEFIGAKIEERRGAQRALSPEKVSREAVSQLVTST